MLVISGVAGCANSLPCHRRNSFALPSVAKYAISKPKGAEEEAPCTSTHAHSDIRQQAICSLTSQMSTCCLSKNADCPTMKDTGVELLWTIAGPVQCRDRLLHMSCTAEAVFQYQGVVSTWACKKNIVIQPAVSANQEPNHCSAIVIKIRMSQLGLCCEHVHVVSICTLYV